MIYTVSAEGFDVTPKLQKYMTNKVHAIEKYIPRHARQSAVLAVHFKIAKQRSEKTCTFALELPLETLAVRETSDSIQAALESTTTEMKRKLADYKSKHSKYGLRHGLFRRSKQDKVAA